MRINIKASYKSAFEWIQQMNALLRCFLMNGVAYTEGRSPAGVWPIYLERALSPRQRVDHSRKLCVCFYSSLYGVQAAERAQTWISKGEEQALLPLGQRWEGIRHRPSHPWLYSAFVGGQRGFRPRFLLWGEQEQPLNAWSSSLQIYVPHYTLQEAAHLFLS